MRPWKKLSSSSLVNDDWLRITADRCELPNGRVLDPFYVMHEKDWAQVYALNAQGQVMVVRQFRYPAGITCLELPGGVIEQGEDPLVGAQRELLEETGCVSDDWSLVGAIFANPARQTNRVHIYIARNAVQIQAQSLDASEEIECQFVWPSAVQTAIDGGEFSQALHIAAFYMCQHRLAVQQNAASGRDL